MLKLLGARAVTARDGADVHRVLAADPVGSCMIAARVEEHGIEPRMINGELWSRGGPLSSLCYSGANLVPLRGSIDDLRSFAERATRSPRACSSLVGRAELTLPLWDLLRPEWGAPRELRAEQPLLALSAAPTVDPDPAVTQVTGDQLEVYLTAAVAMFIEEVGVDPRAGDGGRGYRRRIAGLIAAGRAWARFEDGQVIFKAEVGSMSSTVGQIQGVWVHPLHRGRGLGSTGTAAVSAAVVAGNRTASLYVNSYNHPARRAYERVGFRRVGTFSTVLLD